MRPPTCRPWGATVGKVPSGLPSIVNEHITVSELWVLLPSALGMMLVIFSEALGAGQTFADKHGYRLQSSQELIALGLANIGSGFLGGLACGGACLDRGQRRRRRSLGVFVGGSAVLSLITLVRPHPTVQGSARSGAGRP